MNEEPPAEFVPASELPKHRQVDSIAISIIRTMSVVLAEAPPGTSLELAKEIAISAHIDARHRGIDLEALDTGEPLPGSSGGAQGAQNGQYDIFSQEDPTPQQVKLYNLCTDKVETYLIQIGTPQAEATKILYQFLEGMHVDKYNKPFPRTQADLKRGPMSYLITEMKRAYPKAIPPREGQK